MPILLGAAVLPSTRSFEVQDFPLAARRQESDFSQACSLFARQCIFEKCIFEKCIFEKYIFEKCIFRKCIFRKCIFRNFCKFLAGSFSAVSKRNFARKYAFDSIFQALQDLHTFAPLQPQNFRKKSVWKNSNFRENSAKISQMSQNLQNIAKFQKIQLDNLVDFAKCWRTHIYLQRSAPIQPKTSAILPKICWKLATTLRSR